MIPKNTVKKKLKNYYKKGEMLQPNLGEMKKCGLRKCREGEFRGYTDDGSLKIRLLGNKVNYFYHPSFWRRKGGGK